MAKKEGQAYERKKKREKRWKWIKKMRARRTAKNDTSIFIDPSDQNNMKGGGRGVEHTQTSVTP